ncbi:MAG: PD-(D/E)XK nuclease family protein [Flavobacteriaceae bacterium]|nr:PD-(D/E)XK nuclease family protein [Flavobacteriaceae bacterium]
MQSFLTETIQRLHQGPHPLSEYTIILPSKRAGGFLNQLLVAQADQPFFSPKIYSIEDFVAEVSGVSVMPQTDVLLAGFSNYQSIQKTSFTDYLQWAETMLGDFNELDRHLVAPEAFFDYLSQIKALDRWNLEESATPLMTDYLKFWETLLPFYTQFKEALLAQGQAYQGLVYRRAAEDLSHYLNSHGSKPHAFIGFNALNPAEQIVIQELLAQGHTEVFWDMDHHFIADQQHSVSHFLRAYLDQWPYYCHHPKPNFPRHFEQAKRIRLVQADSDLAQVKMMTKLLSETTQEQWSKTALVLADESLLIPVLYALPQHISSVNITMGYPLKSFPGVWFVSSLLHHYKSGSSKIHHNTLKKILTHPFGQRLVPSGKSICQNLDKQHRLFISLSDLIPLATKEEQVPLKILFAPEDSDTNILSRMMSLLNQLIQTKGLSHFDRLGIEKLFDLCHRLEQLERHFGFLQNTNSIVALFDHLLQQESLDFEGNAYSGLQVMGMLETRVLDFEHLMVLSVNEGILPQGKSTASFITYDMKKEFGLPLHTEKDAIYAYHFFRLLQRATDVTLIYQEQTQGLNVGEKSRFVRLLQLEQQQAHDLTQWTAHQGAEFSVSAIEKFEKSPGVMARLKEIAEKGFSPTALSLYIRDPKAFYLERVLKLSPKSPLQDSVGPDIVGTVVHESIKALYSDFVGHDLTTDGLNHIKADVPEAVQKEFAKAYNTSSLNRGKNLIIVAVVQRYIEKLIDWDLDALANGHRITLLESETDHLMTLDTNKPFPIVLKGQVDRVDRCDDTIRIIDFKTGMVKPTSVAISDWSGLISDKKYDKAFQLLTYAYLRQQSSPEATVSAGILSFKNMAAGLMPFSTKEGQTRNNKVTAITPEVLAVYETQLLALINEILDPNTPFVAAVDDQ